MVQSKKEKEKGTNTTILYQGKVKVLLAQSCPTLCATPRIYTWTSADGQYQNQVDYTLCSQRWRSSIQSAKTRPGANCGSDHELLIAKLIYNSNIKHINISTRLCEFLTLIYKVFGKNSNGKMSKSMKQTWFPGLL